MSNLQKPKYYSNFVRIGSNTFDFQFRFNLKTLDADGEEQIEELTTICMSPQHTKAFMNILNKHVKDYEESLGEIRLEPKQGVQKDK